MRSQTTGVLTIPVAGVKVQLEGWERMLNKTGLLLLILACLVIMVTWLGFAVHSYVAAGEAETQTTRAEIILLERENTHLYELLSETLSTEVVQAEAALESYRPPNARNWDFIPSR